MKKVSVLIALLIALCLVLTMGAAAADDVAGVYTYVETNSYGLEITWTLTLDADGSYALNEVNVVAGDATYTGTYTADNGVITCSAMNEEGPGFYEWADPAGFTVTVDGDAFAPAAAGASAEASGEASGEMSDGGWPLTGSGDTSMDAYKSYLKAYMDCVPEMDGHEEELYGLIDEETFSDPPVCMAFEDQFAENAMTYDEFVAANGVYALSLFGETNPANGDPT